MNKPVEFGAKAQLENLFVAHCSRWKKTLSPDETGNPASDPDTARRLTFDIMAASQSKDPDDIASVRRTISDLWARQDKSILATGCMIFRRSNQTRTLIRAIKSDGSFETISVSTGPTQRHPTEGLVPVVLNGEAYHRTSYSLVTGTFFRSEQLDLEDVFAIECEAYTVP